MEGVWKEKKRQIVLHWIDIKIKMRIMSDNMAKEILAVPEDNLEEVIKVIRAGLDLLKRVPVGKEISEDTRRNLEKWCKEKEEYLKEKNIYEEEGE